MWFRSLLFFVLFPPPLAAQAPGVTVSGVVHDSIARAPLAGATVQLVGERAAAVARTAVSDSLGRFAIGGVPAGRYMLGFFHPMLDSIGVDAPLREVRVAGTAPVRADLAVPSPARIRAAICGPKAIPDSTAVLVGLVIDAHNRAPAADVTVIGEWLEVSFGPSGMIRRFPRLIARTGDNGWFAMCGVPGAGVVILRAGRGSDSTDLIEVDVPAEGFARRDLYVGPARTIVIGDTTRRDSMAPSARRIHTGDGRLSGTVVAADGGRPLAGAQVTITSGPQTRANERGEWTLVDAPVGTRMLEARALGYYPERRAVNIIPGAPPIRFALSTLKAVLDTVRISAARRGFDRDSDGFQRRRRTGLGQFVTEEDIVRRAPITTSDLFRNLPGVRLELGEGGFDRSILVRGNIGEWCSPAIYLDGRYLPRITADDVDIWVRPREVKGIEVYAGLGAPAEYQEAMTGCGSILIWSK